MGFWKWLEEVRERIRLEGQREPEKAQQARQRANEELKKTLGNFKEALSPSTRKSNNELDEDTEGSVAPKPKTDPERQKYEELLQFISDPTALDELSDIELERLRLTTESDIEVAEEGISNNEQAMSRLQSDNPGILDGLFTGTIQAATDGLRDENRKRRLLLKFIEAHRGRKATTKDQSPQPALTKAEQRESLLSEIQTLQAEKASALEKMRANRAGDDEIRRYENMYDNAINRLETKLENLLIR